jgi:BCCT family betaine/carnitine transporter
MATQVAIIIGVTAVAIFSVVRGLEGGVKVLSNINMTLAAILLLFVIILGPTIAIIVALGTTATSYIENIIPLSNWIGREDDKFFHGWTVFYWAWWISWSPFVGMFIARISRGRTVREFIIAVLLVPTLVTLVWMSAFGGSALEQAQNEIGALAKGISEVSLAMFQMLENLPIASISSFVAIVLVLIFFVTSSDSGSLVIDSITSGGKLDAPVPQRIFWATMEGVIAGALLFGGGGDALGALQAAAITVGLPFTLVLLVMCLGVYLGLAHEWRFVQGPKAKG